MPGRFAKLLVAELDRFIFGQQLGKEKLAHALWMNRRRMEFIRKGVPPHSIPAKLNMMMVAPTGQGKTLLFKTAAAILKVPFLATLATSYSTAGYSGQNVEDMIANVLKVADNDIALASQAIILIDEIDKAKARKRIDGGFDVGGVAIQQALLGIVEGTMVQVDRIHDKILVDTSGITFVCGGALEGLEIPAHEKRHIPGDALLKIGMTPEFLGRFTLRVGLGPLTEKEMKRLLVELESSEIKRIQNLFQLDNVELVVTDKWIDEVVAAAMKLPTGVRGLTLAADTQPRVVGLDQRPQEFSRRGGFFFSYSSSILSRPICS
jgi:ATP-dependent Clp protease ATP-binding subunit ClpX